MEETGEGLRAPKRIGTLQEDQQSQLTWILGGSQRLSHQPKSKHRFVLGPSSMCNLVFKWVPQQREWGLSLNLLPACGSCSPNWAALSGLNGGGCAYFCSDLRCQDALASRGSSPFSEEKGMGDGKWGRGCVRGYWDKIGGDCDQDIKLIYLFINGEKKRNSP